MALGLLGGCASAPRRSDALWAVVRICTWDQRLVKSPWPCLAVDSERGFVLIPDLQRRSQVLYAPTDRITGIESPKLLAPAASNDWAQAWVSRDWLARRLRLKVADPDVGLAINSVPGRTQDQLHIHIDCLRPSVRRAVDADLDEVRDTWRELATPLFTDHRYRARWLAAPALPTTDPFRLLAADPATGGGLADWTLVMVAAVRSTGAPGFVLLSHKADLGRDDLGAGEELLDHRCAVLHGAPAISQARGRGRA